MNCDLGLVKRSEYFNILIRRKGVLGQGNNLKQCNEGRTNKFWWLRCAVKDEAKMVSQVMLRWVLCRQPDMKWFNATMTGKEDWLGGFQSSEQKRE